MQLFFFLLSFTVAFPLAAEAASFQKGSRVMVTGRMHRKCSASVNSLPSPGYATLTFDRAGCGDSAQPYAYKQLQRLEFVTRYHGVRVGDSVVLKGHFASSCSAKVKELTRSGLAALEFESLLCTDTDPLYKVSDLTRIEFVQEAALDRQKFLVGQKISTEGITKGERCRGEIVKLTTNGLAALKFDGPSCAYGGKLYSLEQLKASKTALPRHRLSGEAIFKRVMREIASNKAKKKSRL